MRITQRTCFFLIFITLLIFLSGCTNLSGGNESKNEGTPKETGTNEAIKCRPCPSSTPWSTCENGKKYRNIYECGPETDYICESSIEEALCKREIILVE